VGYSVFTEKEINLIVAMSPLKRPRQEADILDESLEIVKTANALFISEPSSSNTKQQVTKLPSRRLTHQQYMRINTANDDLLPVDMLNDKACYSPTNEDDDDDDDSMDNSDMHRHKFSDKEPTPEQEENERLIFDKARHYLNPGPTLRHAIYLFGERKMVAIFCIHFVCTLVIWTHFFLIKFDKQAASVPTAASRYWWKRLVPPLEFGTMHAILFQMALIPLTMTRYSIANLSESFIHRFVPLNRVIQMHIHLGYSICILLVTTTILFFTFFGLLCSDGDQAFCSKFTSEIMCTGYGILAAILILLGTSYFRNRMPYEVFYAVHHLVFVFYVITIVHTLDDKQRSGESQRSQTFKWFSSTLLYYLCDRAAMYLNNRYTTRLVSSTTIEGSSNGSRMIILRLKRPTLFNFKPGQYAYLRLSSIDHHWHPFSIASGPASSYLEFYIEVFGKDSWTNKLWSVLEGDGNGGFSEKQIDLEVLGPCGTSLAKTEEFSHGLAIGTGTGIVPVLSLYKQHVRQLLRMDPYKHFNDLEYRRRKIMRTERALAPRKGSLAHKIASACTPRFCQRHNSAMDVAEPVTIVAEEAVTPVSMKEKIQRHECMKHWRDIRGSIKDMQCEAFDATRSIYGVVLLSLLPAFGVLMIGLTISWNTVNVNAHDGMKTAVEALTVLFQIIFAVIAIFIWDGNQLFAYTDAALCVVTPFADWYWFLQYTADPGHLSPGDITTYSLLIGYMTVRLWNRAVEPRHTSWRHNVDTAGIRVMDRLEICWVARSASLVSELMPDINCIWDALVEQWGKENAAKVCKISVFVTDKDEKACELLRNELCSTELFQDGAIKFGRPDFATLIEDHTLRIICTKRKSYSVLAFCGSKNVAEEIHHHKVSNDMITAITGNKSHQMEFAFESYGGSNRETAEEAALKNGTTTQPMAGGLTTRAVISYQDGRKFLI